MAQLHIYFAFDIKISIMCLNIDYFPREAYIKNNRSHVINSVGKVSEFGYRISKDSLQKHL